MVNPNVLGLHAAVVEQPITETLETNYMPYAMSVIVSRAIPEIDGFKPSHRKLLYTMYKMGLLNGGRTKSANIVGQTMRLNPHGDAAIYDTMVRLSTGYDFVDAVIDVALGIEPPTPTEPPVARRHAAIRFVFSDEDRAALARLMANDPDLLRYVSPLDSDHHAITDSASRYGYFIFAGDPLARLAPYLPEV